MYLVWTIATVPVSKVCHVCAEQHVLEVGCGVNPLCCLAALHSARRVVCTDGSPETLERLAGNLSINAW